MTIGRRPDPRVHGARRRDVELRLLEAIVEGSPLLHPMPGAYTQGVLARLDQRGDSIRPRPADEYLRELAEEALDLGGWALIAAQHPRAARLLPTLIEVAAYGVAAHAILSRDEARP